MHLIRMPHLRSFVVVAQERSITRAAEILGSVQPSVSRTIKELEEIAGAPLFDRTSHGLVLTRAGELLYTHVSSGLAQVSAGFQALSDHSSENRVAVFALPNVMRTIMPGAVFHFKRHYPDIRINLLTTGADSITNRVREGDVDFGFGRLLAAAKMEGLKFEHLYSESLRFFVRTDHPLASSADVVSLQDINRFQVVVPVEGTIIRDELNRYAIANGLPGFANIVETISFEFARNYLQMGEAVIVQPRGAMRFEVTSGKAVEVNTGGDESMVGSVGLTTRTNETPTPAASFLMDMIRQEVQVLGLS